MNINPKNGAWFRQEIVNVQIERCMRAERDHGARLLLKCEVCWTCEFFSVEDNQCFLSEKDVIRIKESCISLGLFKPINTSQSVWKYFFESINIKKPTWYRCKWWQETK